jgi:DNA polymerase
MPNLFWDIESRSTLSLEIAGAWRYASDLTTEILCIAYAVDDGKPQIWIPPDPIPTPFITAASDPSWCIIAHNFMFERALATRILGPRYGWPQIPLAQQYCTMTMALASALPGELEAAAVAAGLPYQKDREGNRAMRLMSRPRRPGKGEDPNKIYWTDTPERREKLYARCKYDVEGERALFHRLPPLPPREHERWQLDAIVNERGFFIDVALATAARAVAQREQASLNVEIAEYTKGEITSVHQVARITAL